MLKASGKTTTLLLFLDSLFPKTDLKERRGYSHLKEEALDRTLWTARFGRGFGPVVRQTSNEMNACFIFTEKKKH